jgi:hypothetical protein
MKELKAMEIEANPVFISSTTPLWRGNEKEDVFLSQSMDRLLGT